MSNVRILEGDLLKSDMHALVNTVNTVGVMGKGVALAFKKRYPDMYRDYVKRCDRGEVRLGEPYVYRADDHLIVNFPTKRHWRSVSRLSDIEAGLDYLERHYKAWQIKSLAVPPLGCGNGQLEWRVVGPILLRHLKRLEIPVELYAPHGSTLLGEIQLDLLDQIDPRRRTAAAAVAAGTVARGDRRDSSPIGIAPLPLARRPYNAPEDRVFCNSGRTADWPGIPTS